MTWLNSVCKMKLIVTAFLIIFQSYSFKVVNGFNTHRTTNSISSEYPTALSPSNFDSYVYGHNYEVLVEFYSSFCGYCKRLKPRYERFAKDISEWDTIVRVAKVNCEEAQNLKLCRKHKSSTYPTFRFYGPQMTTGSHGIHIPIEDSDKLTVNMMKAMVIKQLEEHLLKYPNKTTDWPNIKPLRPKSEEELYSELDHLGSKSPIVFIVESTLSPQPLLSQQVALDLSEHRHEVKVISVFDESGRLFDGSKDKVQVFRYVNKSSQRVELLKEFVITPEWSETQRETNLATFRLCAQNVIRLNVLQVHKTSTVPPLTRVDLYNAVRHSLYHNAALRPAIQVDEIDILVDYLDVIVQYFPFEAGSPYKGRLAELKTLLLKEKAKKQPLKIEDYDKIIESEEYVPPIRPYIKCKGSHPDFRGYPCSLWSLFHTLTVAEYETLKKTNGTEHRVLFVMRRFIGQFFTCKYCAKHFLEMSEPLLTGQYLASANSSVLWLWQGHNQANKRLQCDLSEDPEAPKVQFPTTNLCPKCHSLANKWNEKEVLNFLVQQYSADNIVNSSQKSFISVVLMFFVLIVELTRFGNGRSI